MGVGSKVDSQINIGCKIDVKVEYQGRVLSQVHNQMSRLDLGQKSNPESSIGSGRGFGVEIDLGLKVEPRFRCWM